MLRSNFTLLASSFFMKPTMLRVPADNQNPLRFRFFLERWKQTTLRRTWHLRRRCGRGLDVTRALRQSAGKQVSPRILAVSEKERAGNGRPLLHCVKREASRLVVLGSRLASCPAVLTYDR